MHTAKKEDEAALYSIELAIEYTTNNLVNNPSRPAKLEYVILQVNTLKRLGRYQEALEQLDQLLGSKDYRIREKNPHITDHDLHELKRGIEQALGDHAPQNIDSEADSKDSPYFSYRFDSRCKIENSPVVGRHFIATQDIPESTILLEEKPYCTALSIDYVDKRCSSCHAELMYKCYPCWHCTEAIYCNRKCGKYQGKLILYKVLCDACLSDVSCPLVILHN